MATRKKAAPKKAAPKKAAPKKATPKKKSAETQPTRAAGEKDDILDELRARFDALPQKTRAPLDKALVSVDRAPAKLATAAKALTKKLGQTEAAIALLDGVAAIILASNAKQKAPAGDCFAAARVISRKLAQEVDAKRALAVYERFAKDGALWVKELTLLAKSLDSVDEKRLARLAVTAVTTGEIPSADLMRALAKHGADVAAFSGILENAPGRLLGAEQELWRTTEAALASALDDERAFTWVTEFAPATWRDVMPWATLMKSLGMPARVAERTPDKLVAYMGLLTRFVMRQGHVTDERLTLLGELFDPVVQVLRERGELLSITYNGPGVGLRPKDTTYEPPTRLLAPEIVELLLSRGLPLAAPPERATFHLHAFATRESTLPYFQLEHIAADAALSTALARSFLAEVDADYLPTYLDAAVRSAGCRDAIQPLVQFVKNVTKNGTIGMFEAHAGAFERLTHAAAIQHFPALGEALLELDPVSLFQHQLAAGLLCEWGWPAHDEAAERLGVPLAKHEVRGTFPHLVLHDKGTGRIVVAGAEGVVFDEIDLHAEAKQSSRTLVYSSRRRDVLFINWNGDAAHWVKSGEERGAGWAQSILDTLDGALLTSNGSDLSTASGDLYALWKTTPQIDLARLWYDGTRLFVVGQRALHVGKDGSAAAPAESCLVFSNGEYQGSALPEWMQELFRGASDDLAAARSFQLPVPRRAERSPLGARNGFAGFATFAPGGGTHHHHGIDGRSYEQNVRGANGYQGNVVGLMTFPERQGLYPLANAGNDVGIHLPDGETVLVPVQDRLSPRYSGGAPQPLDPIWWHLFEPRDLAGSRALRDVTRAQAEAVLGAATLTLERGPAGDQDPAVELDYPDLRVTLSTPPKTLSALGTWPAVAAAAKQAFPSITHPRLLAGVVRMAITAAEHAARIRSVHAQVTSAEGGVQQSSLKNRDVAAIDRLLGEDFRFPGRSGQELLGQQILDVADFLFGDRPAVVEAERPRVQAPARCFVGWDRVLGHAGDLVFRLLAPGTPAQVREQLRRFLELWSTTPFALPNPLRMVHLGFRRAPFTGLDRDHSDRLAEWENRYFLRLTSSRQDAWVFRTLEVTRDGTFRLPPGAELVDEVPVCEAPVAAALKRSPFAYDPSSAELLANETGLMLASAKLLLTGASCPVEPDRDSRKLLGLTLTDVEHGQRELACFPLEGFHASLLEDIDRDLAPRMARAFVERFGKQVPLSSELIDRLQEDVRNPHPPFQEAARALVEPQSQLSLTKDVVWVHRPFHAMTPAALQFGSVPAGWPEHSDQGPHGFARRWPDPKAAFSYEALSWFPKYLAWAYLELPIGDPVRLSAHRMAELMRARLASSTFLLPAGMGKIVDRSLAEVGGAPYRADDGGLSAQGMEQDGVVRVWPDEPKHRDGLFVSLRTSKARELRLLDGNIELPGCSEVTAFPYVELFRLWSSRGFQSLLDHLGTSEPEAAFVADPRVSVPDLVRALAKKSKLSEDAAALVLQIRALGEPTPARVSRYNGWNGATYRRIADEAIASGLVVRAAHRGTTRDLFTQSELVFLERFPAPIEKEKLTPYRLCEAKRPILDVPLPCLPVEELFHSLL